MARCFEEEKELSISTTFEFLLNEALKVLYDARSLIGMVLFWWETNFSCMAAAFGLALTLASPSQLEQQQFSFVNHPTEEVV